MFKVTAYAYECGIYSTRQMEESCRYRVDFMWLLEDQPVPDHSTFARFRTGRCAEAVEDLFYQYVKYLETHKETDHEAVFIDGTKMESRAGRYTFCWRGSIEKNLAKVKAEVLKLTGLKTLRGLSKRLVKQADGVGFVSGYGHRKTQEQRDWERLHDLEQRWAGYEAQLEIMGTDRNSYSKTDTDATFMRMKEDHIIFDDDSTHYYTGRASVSDPQRVRNGGAFIFTVNAEPFRYSTTEKIVTATVSSSASSATKTVTNSGRMPVCPTITASKACQMVTGGITYSLLQGTQTIPAFILPEGDTTLQLTITGGGTVSFKFREGWL